MLGGGYYFEKKGPFLRFFLKHLRKKKKIKSVGAENKKRPIIRVDIIERSLKSIPLFCLITCGWGIEKKNYTHHRPDLTGKKNNRRGKKKINYFFPLEIDRMGGGATHKKSARVDDDWVFG